MADSDGLENRCPERDRGFESHPLRQRFQELVYAPSLGHPARLSGREEVIRHVTWFVGAVEDFRFFDLRIHAFADPDGAVAEVKAEEIGRASCRERVL